MEFLSSLKAQKLQERFKEDAEIPVDETFKTEASTLIDNKTEDTYEEIIEELDDDFVNSENECFEEVDPTLDERADIMEQQFESDDYVEYVEDEGDEDFEIAYPVPRNEEVKFEKVTPKLVLTADYLIAKEALRSGNANDVPSSGSLKCSKCSSSFSSEAELKMHINDHVLDAEQKCSKCKASFKLSTNYNKHVASCQMIQFICQHCGIKLKTRIQWRSHLRNHDKRLKYKCPYEGCEKIFRVKHHLNNHLRSRVHLDEAPFVCSYCNSRFRQKHALTLHIRKHNGDFKTCDQCKSAFLTAALLKKHQASCDGIFKPFMPRLTKHISESSKSILNFTCPIDGCSNCCTTKPQLQRHLIKVHQIEINQSTCVVCLSDLETVKNLRSHIKDHLPFACSICSLNFLTEEKLLAHIDRSHSDNIERNHSCPYCQSTFKRAEHCRTHIKYKHSSSTERNLYKCDQCSFSAPLLRSIATHVGIHSKKSFQSCPYAR